MVLTFSSAVAVSSKWSQHFSSMFSAMLYILLTLWWKNPSRCGSTTKPLASHLQGADSPTQTARKCTFHRVEKGAQHTTTNERRERGGKCGKYNRHRSSTNTDRNIGLHMQHKHTQQEYQTSKLSSVFASVQHNLLQSHGTESSVLLYRFPASDAVTREHQPEHVF